MIIYSTCLSKFSSGLSRSETITATVSLQVMEDFNCQRYSICCGISLDVGSTGIVRNTKTFTAKFKRNLNNLKEKKNYDPVPEFRHFLLRSLNFFF